MIDSREEFENIVRKYSDMNEFTKTTIIQLRSNPTFFKDNWELFIRDWRNFRKKVIYNRQIFSIYKLIDLFQYKTAEAEKKIIEFESKAADAQMEINRLKDSMSEEANVLIREVKDTLEKLGTKIKEKDSYKEKNTAKDITFVAQFGFMIAAAACFVGTFFRPSLIESCGSLIELSKTCGDLHDKASNYGSNKINEKMIIEILNQMEKLTKDIKSFETRQKITIESILSNQNIIVQLANDIEEIKEKIKLYEAANQALIECDDNILDQFHLFFNRLPTRIFQFFPEIGSLSYSQFYPFYEIKTNANFNVSAETCVEFINHFKADTSIDDASKKFDRITTLLQEMTDEQFFMF